MELALAHHAVASKTQVLDKRRAVGFPSEVFMQRRFGVELGEENRIPARKAHHRIAPFTELREIHRRPIGCLKIMFGVTPASVPVAS